MAESNPRPRRVPLIGGGKVMRAIPEADGVDIEIQAGCGDPACPGCGGWVITALTKIEPTNFQIIPGSRAFILSREALGLVSPSGHQTIFRRRGIYRRQSAAYRGEAVG